MIDNINLENVFITSKIGAELGESENIKIKNLTIHAESGPALTLRNVSNVEVSGLHTNAGEGQEIVVKGMRSKDICLPVIWDKANVSFADGSSEDMIKMNMK